MSAAKSTSRAGNRPSCLLPSFCRAAASMNVAVGPARLIGGKYRILPLWKPWEAVVSVVRLRAAVTAALLSWTIVVLSGQGRGGAPPPAAPPTPRAAALFDITGY